MELIDKSAVVAEIEKRIKENKVEIERATHKHLEEYFEGYEDALVLFKEKFLDTLDVKEVDLEKEIELIKGDYEQVDVAWNNDFDFIARHFFELGLKSNCHITASDRGMAEEIIINLKSVEKDYLIDLTKEIEWLRNKTKKGKEV